MICVYPPNCTDFSNNGRGAVRPQSCTVTETLNGEWELTLVHPIDELGKWQRLTEGCILRAPVPAAMTPQINLVTQQYQTTTYDVEIYKVSTNKDPLRLRSGTGTKYKILGKYKKGTEVIVLDKTTSSWYEVTCPDGKHGYMSSEYLTYVRMDQESIQTNVGFTNSTIESRQLRDQPFRIYRVVPEMNRVTVHARHIFYDLLDNMVKSIKPASDAVGASVVKSISDGCLSEHDFTFYSDLETTASDVVLENINPVEALLGEEGITGKYGAELARDWFDVFLVSRVGTGSDVQIREKKNLTGISFDVDETDVVTRIMPTGEDADGNLLYLPELYIDSPNINAYPHPKWIHLPVADAKEVTEGDEIRTKDECYKAMRDAVQAEYDAGCDLPTVTLKVDFINCKDTEEYRQFAALTNIFLGDSVRVIARRIGIEVTMRMTQYTYDCLTKKYTSVTLGTAAETLEGTMVAARQLASGSITGVKLALNSIGSGHLQSGSVGSLQVKNAAIQTAHIQNAAITRAHIAEALIETLNVNALNAVTARIQELAAGQITTDELYASIAMIATAQLTTANIVQANIQWAQIQTLATEIATISKAQINTATINSANVDWAAITTLTAAVSTMIKADIGTADIDWSHIKDLATDTAIITEGTAGQLYITRLAVTEANMVSLTVGELVVKGSDGHFYAVGIDKNGNVVTTLKQVVNDDVADLSIHGTEKLIEGSITAQTLNVQEIFGDNATIRSLIAANIDVDTLFAREATLNAINAMDITGNTYLKLMVSKKADQTAIDELVKRMSAAELKITADAIVSTVRSSTAYTTDLAAKASTGAVATAQSAADKAQTTANSAQTAANSAQNTIDSLDIGGRNLLKNSASRPILSGSDFSSASQRVEGMVTTLLETQGNAHNWVQNSLAKTPAEITGSVGAEYSFSVDVKVAGSFSNLCVSFDVRPAETHSYQLICTAYHDGTTYDQWIRLKATGAVKGTDGTRALIGMSWSSSTVGSTIEYRNFKVEVGNRATDWTPAPEDVDAGIADAQSAAATARSAASSAQESADNAQNSADSAQSAADKAQTTANINASNIATLTTRMTRAEQKITADAIVSTVRSSTAYTTDLAGKASTSAVATAQSTADSAKTAASTAQSAADKAQSTANSAQGAASTAQSSANSAKSAADKAQTTANSAQSTADSAKTAASTAQSAADKAQTTANSAQSAASAAQSTANSAQTAASTAQSSANSAKSAADAAQITADTARTAADAAQSSIDSLDIGGRNLLMNSASRPILSSSDYSSASQREAGKITTLLETQGNAYNWLQSSLAKTPAEITESIGAEYSFSVDVKITGSVTDLYATLDVRPADTHTKRLAIAAYHDGATYDQWIRLKGTGAVAGTDGARSLICITWSGSTVGSTIEYRNFKVETGNRATDWTPAPEDVDAGIADAQSAAENAQSTANTAQSTADKAQSTANTNASNITALTTRVTTAEQKITADAIVSTVRSSTAYTTDLAGKASTSAVATAQSTADKAQTTANQNATNITNLTTHVSNAESSITQNANNIALKVSTSTYNAEKVYRGSTAPTTLYTNMLWLDTSVTPNLLKRYNGSAWVVAGAQEVKSSGIYIGSNQVSITTEDFLLQLLDPSDNENVLMEMSADGNVGFKELYADEIISDSVAQAYSGSNYLWVVPSITTPTETDFRSLGEAVQAVNNRHLKEDVYIYLPYGSETYEPGGVTISGIFGSGRLVIYGYGENSILNSYIKVKGCFSNVCFQNVHLRESRSLNGSSRQPYLVEVQQCHFVEFNGCTLDANSITYDSVYARASHVFLYNCGLYNALQGLECYLATGNVKNCCGSCSWSMISYASIIFASGTVPAGSRGTGENGQLYATSVTVDYGTAIPTVTPDENGILYASTTRSWRGSWRTDTLDVIQGVYSDSGYSSSLNWHRGCMWFSTAKSLLSGCTVKSATLTLRRETGSGSGSAKTVYLCAITNTSASGTPSIAKNYGALGTIGRGKQVTFAIPVDAVQGLADGTYGGLCLYETPYNFGSSTYSNCYMRMNGTDTDYEPYIECVYSGSTGNG